MRVRYTIIRDDLKRIIHFFTPMNVCKKVNLYNVHCRFAKRICQIMEIG